MFDLVKIRNAKIEHTRKCLLFKRQNEVEPFVTHPPCISYEVPINKLTPSPQIRNYSAFRTTDAVVTIPEFDYYSLVE